MTDTNQGKNLPTNADEHIARLRNQLTQNDECGTTHYNLAVALMGKKEYDEAKLEEMFPEDKVITDNELFCQNSRRFFIIRSLIH